MTTTDEIIAKGKERYLDSRLKRIEVLRLEQWAKWEPMLIDYLNGLTRSEVCKKYKIDRTSFYQVIRLAGIPIIQPLVKEAAGAIMPRFNVYGEMEKCSCVVCEWIKARHRLKKEMKLI